MDAIVNRSVLERHCLYLIGELEELGGQELVWEFLEIGGILADLKKRKGSGRPPHLPALELVKKPSF